VGKTGQELNRYLDGVSLPDRSLIYVTNLFREYQGKDHTWGPEDLARDVPDLLAELRRVQPRIVITMGRWATRWFLGDVDMDDVHGVPWFLAADSPAMQAWAPTTPVTVMPLYHIAAGFHNPEHAAYVLYDFQQLVAFFAETLQPRGLYDDPFPTPRYLDITDPAIIQLDPTRPVSIDTEGSPRAPWSIQYTQTPGTAFVIRRTRPACVRAFGLRLRQHPAGITYHSALHDLGVMRACGIETNDLLFDDTQVMAYLLQVEPRGLKPLAARHCNMRMQSYEEILGDVTTRLAWDYFVALIDCERADYEDRQWAAFDVALAAGRRVRTLPKLSKTALHKAAERGLRSRTPFRLWRDWEDTQPHIRAAAVQKLGFMPEATLDHVPPTRAIYYGGRDADATERVRPELLRRIQAMGLEDVYRLDLSTYPLIDRMHQIGIKPDLDHFAALSDDLAFKLADLQVQLEGQTAIEGFNANSGEQVAAFVFDYLGLEGVGRTESGRFSTNDKVLEALEHEHPEYPVLTTLRSYRELYKLKYTFVDQIPAFAHRWPHDGRIHATFRTTRVVSGRLAASDPNLLAQPKHGQFAKQFRRGWVAEPGHLLGEWDLSQMELRVLAHLSQDPEMLAIYRGERRNPDGSPVDLHAALAQRIFGVLPKDQDKSKHRLPAKAVNFGLPMGMTCRGLAVELRKSGVAIGEDDAQRWIDETFRLCKGIPAYQERMRAEARRQGFIRCLSGRIRYIGGIHSRDERVRSEAERFAFSTPVQEGAQWIIKHHEASVWEDIIVPAERQGQWVQPLLQVHDALTLEFEVALAQDVNRHITAIMTRAPKRFSVPLEVSGEYGPTLADLAPF
jgi:uracil-DNA glycosylase family 4